ncbi:sensor domain-containing protein [Methanococcoides sp. SA1]|nr:sensor domain-containing protein [Methanococcoides sp. SA1]
MDLNDITKWIRDFFGVVTKRQTYLNLTYLLFTFPLGTAYFIFLVTGLSMGLGLSITLIGLPILILMLVAWWELAAFERQLAIWLLGVDVPPMKNRGITDQKNFEKIKGYILNPVTWKGLVFLFIKFPLGIFTLIVSFILIGITLAFIATPFVYNLTDIGYNSGNSAIIIDSLTGAMMMMFFGMIFGVISLHFMNWMAKLSGILAKNLLGNKRSYMTNENDYTSFDDIELDEEKESLGYVEKVVPIDAEYIEEYDSDMQSE